MTDDHDDDDVEGVCLPFLPDAAVRVWVRGILIKFY
jgi:hypothetical protein